MANKTPHILCVDDEPDILAVVRICLETIGNFKVTTAGSGLQALANADKIAPDLILLDIMMPDMDGPTTLLELRKNQNLDKVPIVFMTARVQPQEIKQYIKIGAFAVIPKPFDPIKLSEKIAGLLKTS